MTSNLGSVVITTTEQGINYDDMKSLVTEELKKYFRPEFLNKVDETIVFRQLTKLEVKDVADMMLLSRQISDGDSVTVEVDSDGNVTVLNFVLLD